jgi:hypothetical protein
MWRFSWTILLSLFVACGGDDRPSGDGGATGDAMRLDGNTGGDGGGGSDAGGADAAGSDGAVTCNGVVCTAGQLCCQVDCDGAMGCTTTDGADCPLLGCPPLPNTPCGTETCERATEICIEGNFGGPTRISCEAVPEGCETDRTCTCVAAMYCNTGLAMCTNTSDNHIFCDTGLD